jgi:hypothetical protein
MIDLGLESNYRIKLNLGDENNPLSPESREIIKKFTENYPNIKVE